MSDVVYEQHYKDNIFDFLLKEDIRPLLLKAEMIGPFYDEDIKRAIKKIEKAKVQLFLDFWDRTKTRRNRMVLKSAKKAHTDLLGKGMAFDHLSLEHHCSMISVQYQLSKTFRDYETKEPILTMESSKVEFEKYMGIINEHSVNIGDIRKLARAEYWKSHYMVNKHNVFDKPVADLNHEQLSLINTTQMYQRIAEHPEPPDENILEDDDALDGWVLYQSQKAQDEKKKSSGKTSKIGNSQEVFYMAENQEQREDILSLNTNASHKIQKNRMNQVMDAQGAAIDSANLTDVRQTLNEAVANKQKKV